MTTYPRQAEAAAAQLSAACEQLAPGIAVQPATAVPDAALAACYDRLFAARTAFLKAHWRWLYRVGEYDWAPPPLVAVTEGQVIGHLGAIPIILRRGTEERRALWVADLAVAPEFQRRHLGSGLMRAMQARCPLQVGFGNQASVAAYQKIGWRRNQQTQSLQMLLRPEALPQLRSTALAPLGQVVGLALRLIWRARAMSGAEVTVVPATAEQLAVFAEAAPAAALHVVRSPQFLSWRVLRHPAAAEHCVLRYRVDAQTEYAALARRVEQQGVVGLHLLSLCVQPWRGAALSGFFAAILRWALRENVQRVRLVSSCPALTQVARWWLPLVSPLSFICYAQEAAAWEYLTALPQHWECLDNDFDLF